MHSDSPDVVLYNRYAKKKEMMLAGLTAAGRKGRKQSLAMVWLPRDTIPNAAHRCATEKI